MTYELHPLCTLFPRMVGDAFDSLVADIRANGLREPIVLHDGMILDGGNRYRACLEAGVSPTFAAFDGGSIVAFVLSANLHRRHMTPGQQAAIVAAAQDWATAHAVGSNQHAPRAAGARLPDSEGSAILHHLASAADRAAESGASLRTQKMADKVAKADPELAKKVAHGEVTLPVAVEQITGKRPGAKPKAKPEPEPVDRDDLQEAINAVSTDNDRLIEENKSLRMAASPDALTEIEKLKTYIRAVELRRDQLMNENAQLKREIKALRRRLGE